jgi:ubiquinone/menaquinone biosynthesis C-methylase UbiE
VLELIAPFSHGKVLEVGCGPGVLLSRLGSPELDLYGLDCCPEMIAEAKKRTAGTKVRLTVGLMQQLPFKDQSFDLVLALGVLEYLPQLSEGLNEIARVAKPNAVIVVSMLNVLSVYDLWQHSLYSPLRNNSWLLRQRKREIKPLLFLHPRKSLMRIMRACNLEPVKVKYFDANICVPPFDSEYPQRARMLNRWVEGHSGPWSSLFLHRAFLVKARRNVGRVPQGDFRNKCESHCDR